MESLRQPQGRAAPPPLAAQPCMLSCRRLGQKLARITSHLLQCPTAISLPGMARRQSSVAPTSKALGDPCDWLDIISALLRLFGLQKGIIILQ